MADLYYENGKIRITSHLFVNGQGQSYMVPTIRHITDVRKGKSVVPLVLGVVVGAAGSFYPLFPYSDYVIGAVGSFLVTAYFMAKDRYQIFITTPNGEVKAFETKKEAVFVDVLKSLKRAVASHSVARPT